MDARQVGALNAEGFHALHGGAHARALELLRESLHVCPSQPEVQLAVGALLMESHLCDEALECFDEALRLRPGFAEAFYNRGNALLALQRPDAAAESYGEALKLDVTLVPAFNNRGTALHRLRRFDEALLCYQQALRLKPDHAAALNNCGNVLRDMNRLQESLAYCEAALRLQPRYAGALTNRGSALLRLDRRAESEASFREALAANATFALAWQGLGLVHAANGKLEECVQCFEHTLRLDPDAEFALGFLQYARRMSCDWRDDMGTSDELLRLVRDGHRTVAPFVMLFITDCSRLQLRCARIQVEYDAGSIAAPPDSHERHAHETIRVGYMSSDFRSHPIAFLLAGVLERHDRQRFQTLALSLRPADPEPYGQRIARGVDRFLDLSSLTDAEAAEQIRALEVDILVDLGGHTDGARNAILARRPAPIQVNYLGYPGTLGATYVDYLIADDYVVPEALRPHYAERIVYLPDCFQANDDQRPRPAEAPSRAELGLPENATVLCCFNNSYKITPDFFSIWMRLLQASPGTVLWLAAFHEPVERNLRREAAARGIDPQRLIFAPVRPYDAHLARLGHADLFLDTLPFNGGTTVSDALWATLPVLTVSGEAFAARMGGSLLRAVGLPELIAESIEHYEQLALELLRTPERLTALRERLSDPRSRSALFDTQRFTRHLECAYTQMIERYRLGLPPTHLRIEPERPPRQGTLRIHDAQC
jgi:predicted O-linked N-acetylglucosamine transferase (SPINDLY family)